jgi:hypothetical protein
VLPERVAPPVERGSRRRREELLLACSPGTEGVPVRGKELSPQPRYRGAAAVDAAAEYMGAAAVNGMVIEKTRIYTQSAAHWFLN